jgi:nucleoside-diphosphate-sugar epimerase
MKILITGGLGFIGSYLTDRLIVLGHSVYIFDKLMNFSGNSRYFRDAVKYRRQMFTGKPEKIYQADIRGVKSLISAVNDCKPEIIVHLAAVTMARPPVKFEHLMGPINLYGTLNVLKVFEESKSARRIIFPSSSFAYGHFVKNPQPEESYLKPVNDYGIMKAACEYAIQLTKKEWVILRPTSVYGFTDCANRVTQLLWDAAICRKPAWVVRGEALDFTYITDAVEGFVRAIIRPEANRQIFNISRGRARTTADFARILREYFPDFVFEIRPPGDTVISRGAQDITKARKILGYKPKYDIEDGIRETIRLMKKYGQIG